jgi:uncharacterized protein YoxC
MDKKQEQLAKLQCILTGVAAACCLGILILLCTLVPRVYGLVEKTETVLTDLEAVTGQLEGQMEGILTNLEEVTQELAQTDLAGMVENVDTLATTSQSAVEHATEKLDTIDLDTLNKAIKDLADVVEPLARFFNVFN